MAPLFSHVLTLASLIPARALTNAASTPKQVLGTRPGMQLYFPMERIESASCTHFVYPLEAEMALISINGKDVELGTTKVLIEDIGIGGIRFLCNINLPVRPDLILQFETTILEQNTRVMGHIVWKQEVEEIYQYGLEFIMSEQDRENLVKKLNSLQIQLKNDSLLPTCSFITEDKIKYLKKGSY